MFIGLSGFRSGVAGEAESVWALCRCANSKSLTGAFWKAGNGYGSTWKSRTANEHESDSSGTA
jgi:hypothetical protein